MKSSLVLIIACLAVVTVAQSQTNYRSRQSGLWNSPSTWQIYNGSMWINAVTPPDFSSGTVVVLANHSVTISESITVDQTQVSSGGVLSVDDGIAVVLNDGSGNDLYIIGRLNMGGESFLSGTGNLYVRGTLAVGSSNPGGAIVTGTSEGNVRVTNRTFDSGSTIIYNGSTSQFIGNGQSSLSNVTIQNPTQVSLNNSSATVVSVNNLTVNSGTLVIENDDLTVNGAFSVVTLNGGNIVANSTSKSISINIRTLNIVNGSVAINSTVFTTSLVINANASLSGGSLTLNSLNATSTLRTNGDMSLTGGTLSLVSGAQDMIFNVYGNISGISAITTSGSNVNVNIYGSGALANSFPFTGGSSFEQITISRIGATLDVASTINIKNLKVVNGDVTTQVNLLLTGDLNLATGTTFDFSGFQLEMNNAKFNNLLTGGLLRANSSSNLIISGSSSLGTLSFSPTANTLGQFILNRIGSGVIVTLNSALNITNSFDLQDGIFLNSSGLNFESGSSLSLKSSASLTGTIPTGGPYNLSYSGTSMSTGVESQGSISNMTVGLSATSVLTISNILNVTGNITLNSGRLSNASGFLSIASGGNISRNGSSQYLGIAPSGGPYSLIYSGGNKVTNTETQGLLNNLTINMSGTLTLGSSLNCTGNITINTGILTSGTNSITAAGIQNSSSFNAPSTTISLSGDLISTGTLVLGTCDLILTGTSNQAISTASALTFNDITLLKSSGTVRNNSNQNIRGVLTVSNGATFDADGASDDAVFTLLSVGDAAGSDASIAPLGATAVVAGNITVQRYWSGTDDVYRYISSPVENSTIADLQNSGIPITGPFAESSFPCTGCTDDFTNLGWYDETAPGFIWEGYQAMPSVGMDNTEALVSARGYEVYMWNGVAPSLWVTTGVANQGSYPLEVSHTPSVPALPNEDGWCLVGNPYPSSIRWEDNTDLPGGWTINDVSPIVWVWDVAIQDWKFYDASSNSGNLAGGLIAAGQGFWVQSLAGSPSLTVHENAKSLTSGQYYRTINQDLTQLQVRVTHGEWESSAYLVWEGNVSDVPKFRKGVEGLSLALKNYEGMNFARINMQDQDEYPISVLTKAEGEHTFSFLTEGNGKSGFDNLFLIDKYLKKSMPLEEYTFTVTDDVSSYVDRFVIVKTPVITTHEESSILVYPNPVDNELTVQTISEVKVIELLNSTGYLLSSKNQTEFNESTTIDLTGLQGGMYFIRVVKSDGSTYLHKIIKR